MNIIARVGLYLLRMAGPKDQEATYRLIEAKLVDPVDGMEVVGEAVTEKSAEEMRAEIAMLTAERNDATDRLKATSDELNYHAHRSALLDSNTNTIQELNDQLAAVSRVNDSRPVDAKLIGIARMLCEKQANTGASGERKRAEVYREMTRTMPDTSKRDISMAIELGAP